VKILLVHTEYQQRGGEDVAFEQERRLLFNAGNEVVTYRRSNHEIAAMSALGRVGLVRRMTWGGGSREDVAALLERERPNVVHVHNTFMVISPSIYSACQERKIPVVQTLHNFRLLCPTATFFRDGNVCEECVEHSLWSGVRHGCYRESRAATAAVAFMIGWHRRARTWSQQVDRFIALSEFSRTKFVAAGFPAEKITVKPNFVDPDPGPRGVPGDYALFVGRLSPEKGVANLLAAWEQIPGSFPLHIVGDGPERTKLETYVQQRRLQSVKFLGQLSREETIALMKRASFLVVPSISYENFPMAIAEAFACGTPVLCSRLGGMKEIVSDGFTGLHVEPGSVGDLSKKIRWAIAHSAELQKIGRLARAEYERRYTAEVNYRELMQVYEEVLVERRRKVYATGQIQFSAVHGD
jgi:glycosyltransferase involved in cell wall biosynthesis